MEQAKKIQQLTYQRDRSKRYYDSTYKWLYLLECGKDLIPFFQAHRCEKVAIYGIAELGKMLYRELERTGKVQVVYFMDRNAKSCQTIGDIPVYLPEELPGAPEVDMIVVTAIQAFQTVSKVLLEIRPELPVVSLQKIIDVRSDEEWIKTLS